MSLFQTSIVIQFHVIGMLLPSLFSGDLVKKFGNTNIIYSGVIILFMSIIINTSFDFYYSYLEFYNVLLTFLTLWGDVYHNVF